MIENHKYTNPLQKEIGSLELVGFTNVFGDHRKKENLYLNEKYDM